MNRKVASFSKSTREWNNLNDFKNAVTNYSRVALRLSSDTPEDFHGVMRTIAVDQVHISDVITSKHSAMRTADLIAKNSRTFFTVPFGVSGSGLFAQDDRTTQLSRGEITVLDTTRPYSMEFGDGSHFLMLVVPQHLIEVPPKLVRQLTATRISNDSGIGAILTASFLQLSEHLPSISEAHGTHLVRGSLSLLTALIAQELELRLELEDMPHDPQGALLQQIHEYIGAHLASETLGPASIAAAHHISTRHLHNMFQRQSISVSSDIRERRLMQCQRDLVDPALTHLTVSTIASRWAFSSPAHFSRTFKARFGMSPQAYRAFHLNPAGPTPRSR